MITCYKHFNFYANDYDLNEIGRIINGLGILILDNYEREIQLLSERKFMIYYECLATKASYKKFKKFMKETNFNIITMD